MLTHKELKLFACSDLKQITHNQLHTLDLEDLKALIYQKIDDIPNQKLPMKIQAKQFFEQLILYILSDTIRDYVSSDEAKKLLIQFIEFLDTLSTSQ